MQKHYFYVLHCRDNTLYAGYTTDLERRLKEHNLGRGAKYTRLSSRRPAEMIFAAAYPCRSSAMKQEYAFKQLSRKEKEHYLQTQPLTLSLP
ncbi:MULTISPECIES: GIY-YIG nuclease family protein [Ignatzschineria]|uniref:Endonuclease n=1 Tax=Ignatzschineria cameli TaxID=2182793 RepID=A0A2U2AL08_9GAMM|nr:MULTISPECIES: GIY-YIG nuclease family protein [Ignatzschineria]OYQ81558.1 endonuclease [Ignatzschineria sp. F8392]PWD83842.1 endonuclease [Ignatzschineria cameli]PWD86080.1 endonuclease [Ignatzschineria cameli]PWD88340.1 endonuclease [Ignatzschineria cameli]PWD88545.1 endonuclease [Ignatzschineria cameli]